MKTLKSVFYSHKLILFSAGTAVLYFALLLMTLNRYGFIWDAPENLLTGEHYVNFFASADFGWLDFDHFDQQYRTVDPAPELYNRHFNAPERYPPVANMTAVLSHRLLTHHLGWLPTTDGYHFSVALFAALIVFCLAYFLSQSYSIWAGAAAVLVLTTYPLFYEHAHYNLKDIPFAALVLLALITFVQAVQRRQAGWLVISAISTGLGMGVRVLAIEVWFIMAAVLIYERVSAKNNAQKTPFKWLAWHIVGTAVVFFIVWPWLWPAPISRLQAHLAFGQDVGRGLTVLYNGTIWESGVTLPWHYSLSLFLLTTPLIFLCLGGIGLVRGLFLTGRRHDKTAVILLLLFSMALLRTSWPDWPQYDGTRHMMDGIVAFAGLAGLGFEAVRIRINTWFKRPQLQRLIVGISLLMLLGLQLVSLQPLHPFTGIFYNRLAGGTAAVVNRFPQAYWGSAFRLGADWLNLNSPEGAVVLPRVGGHLARHYTSPHLQIIPDEALASLPQSQTVYLIYLVRKAKFDPITLFADENLTPKYTLSRGNVPIIKIVETDVKTLLEKGE